MQRKSLGAITSLNSDSVKMVSIAQQSNTIKVTLKYTYVPIDYLLTYEFNSVELQGSFGQEFRGERQFKGDIAFSRASGLLDRSVQCEHS